MSFFNAIRAATWAALLVATPALASPEDFSPGPLIENYGPVAPVAMTMPLPDNAVFNVAFDTAERSAEDGENRTFMSAARFLNMHVANGIVPENLHLAVVIHGGAVNDVTLEGAGENAALIKALQDHGVRLIVCGQSASYQNVTPADLLPGVEMALSAMTAHALLQQDGYTLNPF